MEPATEEELRLITLISDEFKNRRPDIVNEVGM